ncbi:hypothetical protein [Hydrogenophaga sp. NFH-34]|uniref:hypothetical protein n=1 Tax=Hydrogenophaga sp. NFH-34 TaxID=2744446 RepID=UPI001F1D0636|nr:hypothetical protein [Hydrogenophaga sp. NFH-34]
MIIFGVDPGMSTGLARYESGRLVVLVTLLPTDLLREIISARPGLVVIEDSRLTSHTWARPGLSPTAQQKLARNVGQIDAWCRQIEDLCKRQNIDFIGRSPREKGTKLDSQTFNKFVGRDKPSNQHERDAALVAWPFRSMKTRSNSACASA